MLLKVGLTGGIASGKTTVSNLFVKLGVPVIDADVIAHALVEPGQAALKEIIETFGSSSIINKNGSLNRAKLRQKIFADSRQREKLELILHPRIRQAMQEKMAALSVPYCLLSIPLLLEKGWQSRVDRVLVVDCPQELQIQRLIARDGLPIDEIDHIMKTQANRDARLAIAHDVIYTDYNFSQLQKQVLALHRFYSEHRCE